MPSTPAAGMTPAQQERWQRLMHWSLDPPAARLGFAAKLAQENRWRLRFAERVVMEYRRFVFVAAEAGHGVCPSEEVDRAWHQHLLDTRSYWEQFCPQMLGGPLHHTPSRGGAEERRRLQQDYVSTLSSYERLFGEAAPADLWPPPPRRFHPPRCLAQGLPGRLPGLLAGVAVAAMAAAGMTLLPGSVGGAHAADAERTAWSGAWNLLSPFHLDGPSFLILYSLLAALAVGGGLLLQRELMDSEDGSAARQTQTALAPLELAFLAGGEERVAGTALQALRQRGELEKGPQLDDAIERDVAVAVLAKRFRPGIWAKSEASVESQTRLHALQHQLVSRGLLLTPERQRQAQLAPWLVIGPVLALGLARLQQASLNGRPSGFLQLLFVLLTLIALVLSRQAPRQSARGAQMLQALVRREKRKGTQAKRAQAAPNLLAFALMGVTALSAAEAMAYGAYLAVEDSAGGGGGDGGCGGGCGGCGGCGG
jgi:uncharacterized protein (TIGR04222 family)